MTREELVKQKAYNLGQDYFPNKNNVLARPNYEAQWVAEACIKMAEWEHKRLVEKACEWLSNNKDNYIIDIEGETIVDAAIIEDFFKAMEE